MSHSFHQTASHPVPKTPTVFLPGWAFDGRILKLLQPAPAWIYPETMLDPETIQQDLLHFLDKMHLAKIRLIGWSMGAMLGLKFGAKHNDRIDASIFVSLRSHWPGQEIKAIRAEFDHAPETFLKGFYRKCFLGDKSAYAVFSATLEPLYLADIEKNIDLLQRGLDFLQTFRLPDRLPPNPTRLIHGKQDIVAPVKEMAAFPEADIEIVDNGGHTVFLHRDCSLQHELRKQIIQMKFSRAASSYDKYAKVQAEVARRLSGKITAFGEKSVINKILEIGCGTGNFTSLLATRFPQADIAALDFSPEMIAKSRQKLDTNNIAFVCEDGEQYLTKTPDASFDLVVSNGSLQWFPDIDKTLHNIARILTPGGSMFCSIFGPESLKELGEGLLAIRPQKEPLAAQAFHHGARLAKALQTSFPGGTLEEIRIEKKYRSAQELLRHIKKTGTSGWQQKLQQPLTQKRINQLDAWFKENYGSCRVTYQIFFLHGKK